MKMGKTPRFLLCENPLLPNGQLYILSTRSGELLMRIIDHPDKSFSLEVEKEYEATDKQVKYALLDAEKWWKGARHK